METFRRGLAGHDRLLKPEASCHCVYLQRMDNALSKPQIARLLLVAMAFPWLAWAQEPQDLREQLHDVVAHGDLADREELSRTLGIGFRVVRDYRRWYDQDQPVPLSVMVTSTPSSLYPGEISYRVWPDPAHGPQIDVVLPLRECLDLRDWGNEWHPHERLDVATDAGPITEVTSWEPGPTGIRLELHISNYERSAP